MDPTNEAPAMDADHAAGEALEAVVRLAAGKGVSFSSARRATFDFGDDGSITVAVTDAPTAPLEGEAVTVSMDEIISEIDADESAEMSAPTPPPAA